MSESLFFHWRRSRIWTLVLIGLLLSGIGVVAVVRGGTASAIVAGAVDIVLFGLATMIMGVRLTWPFAAVVDSQGIQLPGLFRPLFIQWSSVARVEEGRGPSMLVYLVHGHRRWRPLRLSSRLIDFPQDWHARLQDLAPDSSQSGLQT
jgi:hypothetical protein